MIHKRARMVYVRTRSVASRRGPAHILAAPPARLVDRPDVDLAEEDLSSIDEGLADIAAGRVHSHEEIRRMVYEDEPPPRATPGRR